MDTGRTAVLTLLLAAAGAVGLAACASLMGAAAPAPAAEIGHLSEQLAGLVEQLNPGIVQIRTGPDSGQGARPPAAGFIVDPGGIIVTVAHAVRGEDSVLVELADGRRLTGSVIGRDTRTDLAAVRIEAPGALPALHLGDSDGVRVGELVLALGHPYGLLRAVSLGIVSWKGPPPEGGPPGFEFIHTDASVNPGNSGGPLVSLAGEVIGVDSWAARNGSMGIAVPSTLVKLVLPRLIADGHVEWGWLGLSVAEARPEGPGPLALRDAHGLAIGRVEPGGPADQAGLAAGDLIVAVEGEPIDQPRDLCRLIVATPAGRHLRIVALRGGERKEVDVALRPYREAVKGETGTAEANTI